MEQNLPIHLLMGRVCSVAGEGDILKALRETFGNQPFRVADAVEQVEVSRTTLHRLREAGDLIGTARGVLQFPGVGEGMLSVLAVVSARVPGGTICLNSALSFWDLTDEIPSEVHLAVPRGAHRPSFRDLPVRVHQFDNSTFQLERRRAITDANEPFWIYSPERAVVDAVRLSRWVGRDVALHALRRYVSRRGAEPARLAELATQLGAGSRVAPALETLLS